MKELIKRIEKDIRNIAEDLFLIYPEDDFIKECCQYGKGIRLRVHYSSVIRIIDTKNMLMKYYEYYYGYITRSELLVAYWTYHKRDLRYWDNGEFNIKRKLLKLVEIPWLTSVNLKSFFIKSHSGRL